MRRFPFAAALLAVGTIAAGTLSAQEAPKPTQRPGGIFGAQDRRVPVTAEEWPWTAIGRVNLVFGPSNAGFCTGTLIGPRQVLTAASCLFDARMDRPIKPAQIFFVAGPAPTGDHGRSAVVAVATDPAFDFRLAARPRWDRIAPAMLPRDWAILTLKDALAVKPVPWRVLAPAQLTAAASAGKVTRAGYSAERANRLAAHRGCEASIDPDEPGLIRHRCDAGLGDAGSPILVFDGAEAAIAGIHTSVAQDFAPGVGYTARIGGGPAANMFDQAAKAAIEASRP